MPDTLRGIDEEDWDAMDWAKGVKPGEAMSAMGEAGLNRVWSAPDLSFRPEMRKKTEDASGRRKKGKKKGLRVAKMSEDFKVSEDFTDGEEEWENATEVVGQETNTTEHSVLESVWYDEVMGLWIKYGLSPAHLREMRKIKKRLGVDHICTTVDIMEGLPLGACTEFAVPEVHSGVFMDEGCAISKAYWEWKKTGEP